uniref:Uncharacterized protein n=1 Tax=Salix viminalis TaxID=40686 RepID=A0A6N2MR69_SALVM
MTISSKCMLDASPPYKSGHDFILTPFAVFEMVQFLTNIPETGFSLGYLPKLPTLMPCPGPHVTPVTCRCSHGKMLEGEVLALQHINMKVLAISSSYISDQSIVDYHWEAFTIFIFATSTFAPCNASLPIKSPAS